MPNYCLIVARILEVSSNQLRSLGGKKTCGSSLILEEVKICLSCWLYLLFDASVLRHFGVELYSSSLNIPVSLNLKIIHHTIADKKCIGLRKKAEILIMENLTFQ